MCIIHNLCMKQLMCIMHMRLLGAASLRRLGSSPEAAPKAVVKQSWKTVVEDGRQEQA